MTPNKKSMAAAFAVFGSSISGLVRWLFGRWVPSWHQLVYNKVLLLVHCMCASLLFVLLLHTLDKASNSLHAFKTPVACPKMAQHCFAAACHADALKLLFKELACDK